MRRADREITDFSEIVAIMKKCDVCRIALHDGEFPYIVPLNFGIELNGKEILLYFHGALEGKKYDLMRKNNKVAFEMDCSHRLVTEMDTKNCTMEYESVMGSGCMEFVEEEDKYRALCILMEHYPVRKDFWFNEAVIPATNVFRLRVGTLTAKRRMVKQNR